MGPGHCALKALSKPSFESLWEASLKHLTLKTVFLIAIYDFSGRRSELQAFVFDPKYFQFKPKGALYFSPEFMRKNQRPNPVKDPCYIPAVPTGKPDFGALNCPVRVLRYYHRDMTEHPELRKASLFQLKTINTGKELSAATVSRWICTMSPFRTTRVSQERSKLMRSVQWLLRHNSLTCRPTGKVIRL